MTKRRYIYASLWDQVWRFSPRQFKRLLRDVASGRVTEFRVTDYKAVALGDLFHITDLDAEAAEDTLMSERHLL